MPHRNKMHSAHWGAFHVALSDNQLAITPFAGDPDPSPLLENFTDVLNHPVRVTQPMVRRGWLEQGPGADDRRGEDEYLPISWEKAYQLVGDELRRVSERYGPEAVFGGSYGWSSAGRFHHAQSQVHRFLNTTLGGYVRSVNSYSSGAAAVLLPHIIGPMEDIARRGVSWQEIADHSDIVLAFGGLALKNAQVASGGLSEHSERGWMVKAAARGTEFISVSPLRSDLPAETKGEWLPIIPGTDAALILGLLSVLISEHLTDEHFLAHYCVGWPEMVKYITGREDGTVRDAEWAAAICGIDASQIEALARQLAGKRVLVTVAHALQRAEYGEQPVWLGLVLASALGQPGLPGGGFTYALGALGHYGKFHNLVSFPSLPQGKNGIDRFIPVAKIADMLLSPGETFHYNGQQLTYPHIRLVYWAGGNPFHHHQDLGRLRRAFCATETLIVHESVWTATARHADIVLPATLTLEREDIGGAPTDRHLIAMAQVAAPPGEAKDDYDIFRGIARYLGRESAYTEGRTAKQWLALMYGQFRHKLREHQVELPDFDDFFEQGILQLPQHTDSGMMMKRFREDPLTFPLPTPCGKIVLYSDTFASFGYADCPSHPVWLPPTEQAIPGQSFWLVANQPSTRLHSQLDFGRYSARGKRKQREVCTLHPTDAQTYGIEEGDIIELSNTRGRLLACARLSDEIRQGVLQLPTGAWYDPIDPRAEHPFCRHGNPNVLTRDSGTSSLAQGCSGQLTVVNLRKYPGPVPEVRAFIPPRGAI